MRLMTPTEFAFYKNVVFHLPLDLAKFSTDQSESKRIFPFERNLRNYDRVTYRECFMNPKAPSSFPNDADMMFYARLNLPFRSGMGPSVIAHELTHGMLGMERKARFEVCKNGVMNSATGITEGSLDMDERYYYRTMVWGETAPYATIVEQESHQ